MRLKFGNFYFSVTTHVIIRDKSFKTFATNIIEIVFLIRIVLLFFYLQRVGCDLRIGSSKKVDACGVCGGNGSTCSQPMYQWDMAPMSLCSVTCGGGK